jgi:hypothetical protein
MSELKTTPGPWQRIYGIHVSNSSVPICSMTGQLYHTNEQMEANAHLIAAAPEMYEALQTSAEALKEGLETEGEMEAEHSKWARQFLADVEGILAKARGEES